MIGGGSQSAVWSSTYHLSRYNMLYVYKSIVVTPTSSVAHATAQTVSGITYFILCWVFNSAKNCCWLFTVDADTLDWVAIPWNDNFWSFAIFLRQFCWDYETYTTLEKLPIGLLPIRHQRISRSRSRIGRSAWFKLKFSPNNRVEGFDVLAFRITELRAIPSFSDMEMTIAMWNAPTHQTRTICRS